MDGVSPVVAQRPSATKRRERGKKKKRRRLLLLRWELLLLWFVLIGFFFCSSSSPWVFFNPDLEFQNGNKSKVRIQAKLTFG